MELFTYICIKMKVMEAKAKFDVVLSPEASDFLNGLGSKIRDKIVYNIRKSTYIIDPKLFKKLDDTDIWEFRTRHSNTQISPAGILGQNERYGYFSNRYTWVYQENPKNSIKRDSKSRRNKKSIF